MRRTPPVVSEHPQSYSGNNSVDADSSILLPGASTLEVFLGLGNGSLEQLAISIGQDVPSEGSAIKQMFTANAGSILKFNWQYLTDEASPSNQTFQPTCSSIFPEGLILSDFAFVVLDGNILFLADNLAASHDSDTPFADESGYRTFVVRLATGGTHTIGVGVIDTLDPPVNSGVLLDNFRIVPAFAGTPGEGKLSRQECLRAGSPVWRSQCRGLSPRVR